MRRVCKFFAAGECKNPNCTYAHPPEYPMYIYAGSNSDIHPDELRAAVQGNAAMAQEADRVWVANYTEFCSQGPGMVDIVENPDYFCMPFEVDRVSEEIARLKRSGGLRPSSNRGGDYQQRNWDYQQRNGDYQQRNGDYQQRNGDYQQRNGDYQQRGYRGDRYNSNDRYSNNDRRPWGANQSRESQQEKWNSYGRGSGQYNAGGHSQGRREQGWGERNQEWGQRRSDGRGSSWKEESYSRGNSSSGGWMSGRSQNAQEEGSFERQAGEAKNTQDGANSPEYEHRGVPYYYKEN